jgi:DNA (cytosine-5)-methyltransferase 1
VILLDLFCGAGGATQGYQRAGFLVVGVDIHPQPNYCGSEFHRGDALLWLDNLPVWVDAVHASPPCQGYSAMSSCRPGLADRYPKLIEPVREALLDWGGPYVMENVPGAPLKNPVTLCGQMFGLDLYRHRLFESSFDIDVPAHPEHVTPASKAGHWTPGTIMSVAGHFAPMEQGRRAMGIDWMTRDELGEAIPPRYTEHIGASLSRHLDGAVR